MGDAFEDAWELLRQRADEPLLCADGGWQEAQEEATERLREVRGGGGGLGQAHRSNAVTPCSASRKPHICARIMGPREVEKNKN